MNDEPYAFLHAEPAPPNELHALLRYLSDAFTLLDDWILQPAGDDAEPLRIAGREHLSATTRDGAADPHGFELHHPGGEGRPGYREQYERNADGAEDLRHTIVVHAAERTEARSQWNAWDNRPRRAEQIRIALRDAPGYYVQCPLESDDKPMHVIATLETALEDEEPDSPRTREVPINEETGYLLRRLAACVDSLNP